MKKAISIISVIGAILVILDSMSASHWLVLLLMAGVIPGTDIHISPIDMMAANATAITVIILRITVWPSLLTFIVKHLETGVISPARKRTHHRII